MKYSQAKQGRVFVVRLEDGDIIHEEIEGLARKESITAAGVIAVGGVDEGSTLIVGPEQGRSQPIVPMEHVLDNVHEATATGMIFLNEKGEPKLHMHLAAGRQDSAVAGCIRRGVKVWHVLEVIVTEIVGSTAARKFNEMTGFELLNP